MKIGLLTAFNAPNYGAVLQCYALQQLLLKRGHDVEVVNFTPSSVDVHWSTFPFNQYKNTTSLKERLIIIAKFFLFFTFRFRRRRLFQQFVNDNLNVSSEMYDKCVGKIGSDYDLLVVGSDQMWSKKLFGMENVYWGNIAMGMNARIATYAVSSGSVDQFSESDIEYIRRSLSNFFQIGVREEQLNSFVSSLTEKKVVTVLDPTLMMRREAYERLVTGPRVKDKYVLIYRIGDNSLIDEMAELAAKHYDAKIVEIGNSMITHRVKHLHYIQCTPSVGEFLGFFKNATCVFSKSFHGLVFSLMFRKQFYLGESEIMDRVNNLLNIVDLKDRIITRQRMSNMIFDEIDYEKVDRNLQLYMDKSNEFIDMMVKG